MAKLVTAWQHIGAKLPSNPSCSLKELQVFLPRKARFCCFADNLRGFLQFVPINYSDY